MNQRKLFSLLAALLLMAGSHPALAQTGEAPGVENLAFKILQKQAAEYETALTQLISGSLTTYIPADRFHLSVRIFWNPNQIAALKDQNQQLAAKAEKLPGFQIFVKGEEKGLDYYLGAGSVMKLQVEVLLDDKLPEKYEQFLYSVIPVQARFVPERGDSIKVTRIPFPASEGMAMAKKQKEQGDQPLVGDEATGSLLDSIEKGRKDQDNAQPVIIHPVLQKYVFEYEHHIKEKLANLIGEYIARNKFVLNVSFHWNPDEVNKLKTVVSRQDPEGKVKLPGFTIYLEERDSMYDILSNSTRILRMEIALMLDKSVHPDLEPFLKKLIPMSVKLIPPRGDRLVIYRGAFPKKDEELRQMQVQLGEELLSDDVKMEREIDEAFKESNYQRALLLVNQKLAKTTAPDDRIKLLKQKGSLHLLMQERSLAMDAFQEVKYMAPDDQETIELLKHLQP